VKLIPERTALVIVDVQGALSKLVIKPEWLIESLKLMIQGAKLFDLNIIWTEHVPEKIGPTHPEIAKLLNDSSPITKDVFSCCSSNDFMERLKGKVDTILLAGIETHICIYQTARDLIDQGYRVELISDAVSSRTNEDKSVAIQRIQNIGGGVMTVEMALYDLQGRARGDRFRKLVSLVKNRKFLLN